MHKLIENYIQNIRKKDIYDFALKNDILLTEKEQDILYHYLQNNWEEILYGNSRDFFSLENQIDKDKFLKIKDLFDVYFEKYHNLL